MTCSICLEEGPAHIKCLLCVTGEVCEECFDGLVQHNKQRTCPVCRQTGWINNEVIVEITPIQQPSEQYVIRYTVPPEENPYRTRAVMCGNVGIVLFITYLVFHTNARAGGE